MSWEFKAPTLTQSTAQGQLRELKSYLIRQAAQLNWVVSRLRPERAQEEENPEQTYLRLRSRLRRERRAMALSGSWPQGSRLTAPGWLGETALLAVTAGEKVILCTLRQGAWRGEGLCLTPENGGLTVTAAPETLTGIRAIL